LQNEEVKK
jgi:hypothetical protein